jgi:hypothetical protein
MGIKNTFFGVGRKFTADRLVRYPKMKKVFKAKYGISAAEGAHGSAYDLVTIKGKHKVKLVVKKYHEGFRFKQSKMAIKEFAIFNRLRKKGYPIPPTTRLVWVDDKAYVAITDLKKFGDVQIAKPIYEELVHFVGEEKAHKAVDEMDRLTEKAIHEENINLHDAWEAVIDTKKSIVRLFILDISMNIPYENFQ